METKNISPEVRAYFAELGRKNGIKLRETKGSEYFKKISRMRKTYGRSKKVGNGPTSVFEPSISPDIVTEETPQPDEK